MTLRLVHGPVNTRIEGDIPRPALVALDKALRYLPEDARRERQRRGYALDSDFTRLLKKDSDGYCIPSGLLERALKVLHGCRIETEVVDRGPTPEGRTVLGDWNQRFTPRPYQEEQASAILRHKRGIVKSCTGSGKTIAIGRAIEQAGAYPALVVTHSIALLHQTQERLSDVLGMPVGMIGRKGSRVIRDIQPVTVATAQSLTSDLKCLNPHAKRSPSFDILPYLESVSAIHIDEAHHCRADWVKRINASCQNATYRVGWSGTPFREQGDDLEIEGAMGPVIATYGYSDAIRDGYIVAPEIHTFHVRPPFDYEGCSYEDVLKQYVVGDARRNRLIANIARLLMNQGERVLVLVTRIPHGELLSEMLDVPFVQGKNPDAYRNGVLSGLADGTHPCVVATSLMDEGVDIPEATALILAHPTRSLVKTYQRIGRILRPSEGKTRAIVVDLLEDVEMLRWQAKRRLTLYNQEPAFLRKKHSPNGENWYDAVE